MSERSPAALDDTKVAALCTDIAIAAARAILRFDCRNVTTEFKADESPVTAADQASEAAILPALAAALPGVQVVSEESADVWRDSQVGGEYLLVDPLDGTREFLAGSDEYTVNIALVRDGVPVATVSCGSALKFCRVAEGAIDVYPRLAPTSEWDVAAGHALVVAAGGAMTAPDGSLLTYGAPGFRVPGFVAWGDATRRARP